MRMKKMSKVILLNKDSKKEKKSLFPLFKELLGFKVERPKVHKVLQSTVEEFSDLVCSTMGPSGQNILLHTGGGFAHITKDGVTVAKAIDYDLPEKKIIAEVLKQAAESTNAEAGDGTTTATCIAAAVIKEGLKRIEAGEDPNSIRESLNHD